MFHVDIFILLVVSLYIFKNNIHDSGFLFIGMHMMVYTNITHFVLYGVSLSSLFA